MKYLEHFNVLNITLVLAIVFMGIYEYHDYRANEKIKVAPNKKMRLDTGEVKLDDARKLLPRGDYMVVTEKNLFHPERRPVQTQAELPPADFVVYGTIVGSTKAAFVEDKKSPYNTPGRGQRQRTLHEGDAVSGYKVKRPVTNINTRAPNDISP
ncbi:MAG: hypothetical protein HQK97_13190, partial [Nitrospirae bacterium]|nr:hypothetical protein [Nitrospirota bacterium]